MCIRDSGMTMDLRLLLDHPGNIALFLVMLLGLKALVLIEIIRLRGGEWRSTFMFGILLSQGGEFALCC